MNGLATTLQQLPPVKELVFEFVGILIRTPALTGDIVSTLLARQQLDEFLEKLVPLMVQAPDSSKEMWNAFALLFRQTSIEERQEA